ncbi:hypothetical protein SAMN05518848_104102 [Paenibacillus sp. PDC88]|nr:hypothetical protein SAMN05518848_104102 [Paenibacillus sp. PDC88]
MMMGIEMLDLISRYCGKNSGVYVMTREVQAVERDSAAIFISFYEQIEIQSRS